MKSVKGFVSLAMAVLFSFGVALTAFASDEGAIKSITDAAEAVVGSATEAATVTAKEKAGEAMVNAIGEEKKEGAATEEKKEEAGDEAKEEAAEGEAAEEAPADKK